jgi:hypothetical protein
MNKNATSQASSVESRISHILVFISHLNSDNHLQGNSNIFRFLPYSL